MRTTTLTLALAMLAAAPAGAQEVAEASRRLDVPAVEALIEGGADVNAAAADGTTALHWAAYAGRDDLASVLLAAGADASAVNRYGVTPLGLAAEYGDAGLVRRLLTAGADARTTGPDGQTVLMLAARTGAVPVVEALVEAGSDVNARDTWMGETALMWAAGANNADAVRALVAHGAEVDARSSTVTYPEQRPAEPSNYVGSAVPPGQWTPLMYAAREGAAAAAETLLDLGADVNVQDPEGVTPLMQAVVNVHFDLAMRLLDRGADPTIADLAGMTPAFAVVEMRTPSWERSRPRLVERGEVDGPMLLAALLERGTDPDAVLTDRQLMRYHARGPAAFAEGTTALMQAVRFKHLDLARVLVTHGADVTLAQPDGTTALMIAAGVKYAITQEGDPDNMGTPEDTLAIVTMLVEQGANVNAANIRGETPLYGAAFLGHAGVISYLVEQGAALDARTAVDRTIMDAVLNTGVPDEGTGQRPGGKPAPETVELVRVLMLAAGVEPTFADDDGRGGPSRYQRGPVRAVGAAADPDADPNALPATGDTAAPTGDAAGSATSR
jgi:ankyrin repeat protein